LDFSTGTGEVKEDILIVPGASGKNLPIRGKGCGETGQGDVVTSVFKGSYFPDQ
jgi:hypothetical protein